MPGEKRSSVERTGPSHKSHVDKEITMPDATQEPGKTTVGDGLPESPLVGSSYVGAAITGTSFGYAGVSGLSQPRVAPPGTTGAKSPLASDGVFGEGQHGVHGLNGAGSGTTPKFGCGALGESDNGYGVYGASKTASGVYGTSGSGHLAGEFAGDVDVSGSLTAGTLTVGESLTAPIGNFKGAIAAASAIFTGTVSVQGTADVNNITITGNLAADNITATGKLAANNITATGTLTLAASTIDVTGNATVTGTLTAQDVLLSGSDCAEDFEVAGAEQIEPGTVVVFDCEGALRQSTEPYNNRVAGVISGAGNYRPGLILGRGSSCSEVKAPVALIGRVYCKVDADAAPIAVGDMLTSSHTPGHAMKVMDPLKGFGSVIGKALRPLESGKSLLPILVMLQ
jgi:cytoskeletal protein CcmA (bactofilin family)